MLLSTFIIASLASLAVCCSEDCKAYPDTPSWPSRASWDSLNKTLAGRLIEPLPPGGVCHEGQSNYDEDQCPARQREWLSYDWHARDAVSVMWDNWADFACLPDPEKPCTAGAYPAYVVNATTATHVKAGVDFARQNNVRLIVKASGHDFHGRSIAPGALSIWVHHLDSITYHDDHFQLTNSDTMIPGDAVSCGGGAAMYEVYKTTHEHGTTVVGGGAKSVSVGGYLSGGGHSQLSPEHGLAVDNVLEMEVVTPQGEILTVNEEQHPDLFWALRGGGGSTFGVVTSFTLSAHPSPKVQSVSLLATTDPTNPQAEQFVAFVVSQIPHLLEEGLRGYGFLALNGTNPLGVPGLPDRWSGLIGLMSMMDKDEGTLDELLSSLNDTIVEKFGEKAAVRHSPVEYYDSWMEYYDVSFDNGTAGGGAVMVSRLIDEDTLTGDPEVLIEAIRAATKPTGTMDFYPLAGKGVREAQPRGGSNSVNPGWRKAIVHSLVPKAVDGTNNEEVKKELDEAFEPLRKLTPKLGAYLNEAAGFEKDAANTFWGENYDRLLAIKREIDPDDVFWCSPCVGNDRWKERRDGRLCKVEQHDVKYGSHLEL